MRDDHYSARPASSGKWYIYSRAGSVRINVQSGHLIFDSEEECKDFAKALSIARRQREDDEKREFWAQELKDVIKK